MPDLDIAAVSEWIAGLGPPGASPDAGDLRALDAPDDPDLLALEADDACESAVQAFGAGLDRALDYDPQRLSTTLRDDETRPLLAGVIARLSLARQARVIDWIVQSGLPNGTGLVRSLTRPGDDGTGDVIREGMAELYRQRLLARIFSKGRLATLLDACRISQEELQ
ncbi:MAG: hypothetical protein HIU90_17295 [Proteobacteria bacterium]|nr:hypothetical protein [Pseudomonadota bacterium]